MSNTTARTLATLAGFIANHPDLPILGLCSDHRGNSIQLNAGDLNGVTAWAETLGVKVEIALDDDQILIRATGAIYDVPVEAWALSYVSTGAVS